MQTIKKYLPAQLTILLFVVLSLWWLAFTFVGLLKGTEELFAAIYGIAALWGGLWGLHISSKWGGWKSHLGKSIIFFSLGLLLQEFGQISYSVYIYFLHIDIPYPSIGDIGYFGSIFAYGLGILHLSKSIGLQYVLKKGVNIAKIVVIPVLILSFAFFFLLRSYDFSGKNFLTIFLDFGYPIGQAINISLAILAYTLSLKTLGGVMKGKILFLLFAFVIQYLADFSFIYTANNKTYFAGGFADYIYLCAYTCMGLGLFNLKTVYDQIMHK